MSVISVTPEELKQQAQVYIQAKEEIESAIQKVNSMNSTIADEWKGAAFQAYLEQYNQTYQSVQQFENLMESINQQLNKYADTVQERDAQDAGSFGFQYLDKDAQFSLRRFYLLGGALMIKRFFAVCVLFAVILLCNVQVVCADSNGNLQLNDDMITNSNMGTGGSGDFPIRSQLFSPEINEAVNKEKSAIKKLNQKAVAKIKFESVILNADYQTDVDQTVDQLFVDYSPAPLDNIDTQIETGNHLWYIPIIAIGVPLVFLAALLGWWNAGRKRRKSYV